MTNSSLVVCAPNHPALAQVWSEHGGHEWQDGEDGEIQFVIIGTETSDEKCARLAERFDLDAVGLMSFRDRPRPGHFVTDLDLSGA